MKNILILFIALFSCKQESPNSEVIEEQLVQEQSLPISKVQLDYAWLPNFAIENTLVNRIQVPASYQRIDLENTSFAYWLRHIPLKEGKPNVLLYNGQLKNNQQVHAAVIDLDVGTKDLQQCADAVMRLRAEYQWIAKDYDNISFNFTSGDACKYNEWAQGVRPVINGNNVSFKQLKSPDSSYSEFKNYMQMIFNYCGTSSLSKELRTKNSLQSLMPGDVFIQGGFPGHAVMVMDVAIHEETGDKIFLLAQSYMPAQEMHILKNFNNNALSPWFSASFVEYLNTPEWQFKKEDLKQF